MVFAQFQEAPASDAPSLARDYLDVRGASLSLARPLEPEDCVVQTLPEVSPTKWHLAHVTWFFERFCLLEKNRGYRVYDETFHRLFNSYYYTVGEMHARGRRGVLSRPTLEAVLDYRLYVDAAMLDLLEAHADDGELAFRVTLGLQHEQQHQELMLTDIKHVFFSNPIGPAYSHELERETAEHSPAPLRFVDRPGGQHEIGYSAQNGFCFDNETPRHAAIVGEHALADRLVSNGEYREFIDAGGYREPAFWMADGWSRVLSGELERPLYWAESLESEFTLWGWRAIEPAAPVAHLSWYEADAYARWAGARLPLESEWELAASDAGIEGNFLDSGELRPRPAPGSDAARAGPSQLWGDVWEWTSSPYAAYPRFKPLAGSLGEYNGKFMANQMVVRGGSCATWASHMRASYRSFFYPHDRWQFLGLRLAIDR